MDNKRRRIYDKVHQWLKRNYTHTGICEMEGCRTKGLRMEWSLKKGFSYENKRENFWQLCASCHRKYDWTEEQSKKVSEALRNRIWTKKTREKMSLKRIGIKLSQETKSKLSERAKTRWQNWKKIGYSPVTNDPKTGRIISKR